MRAVVPFLLAAAWTAGLPMQGRAETLADRLVAGYDAVQSVQCEVRRDTSSDGRMGRRLSRVYFRRPDHLHVQVVSPLPRRIVADGTNLYSYIDGDARGFAAPIANLDENWLISLRQVPGTPLDHLLRLRGVAEEELPSSPEFPVRRGYQKESVYVVLSLDASNRLARVEFFKGGLLGAPAARYDYSGFQEPLPGVWFPCLQKGTLNQGDAEAVETTRIQQLVVNGPIPENLFSPAPFFPGVAFTADLDALYSR